jgi:O-antigen ligase
MSRLLDERPAPMRRSAASRTGLAPAAAMPGLRPALPTWPLTALFLGVPVWWVAGLGDLVFPLFGAVMLVFLARRGGVEVPRGFGLWLLFLLWMGFSAIELDTVGRFAGFGYRALLYIAVTIIGVYVYNARTTITARYVLGLMVGYWLVVVAGGYLGVFFPTLSITTPLAALVPEPLLNNELVREMVIRRATQFNPDSWFQLEPRPSAPFLYTNGWGNAYSLLMPFVVAYLAIVRRGRMFWFVVAAIPVSFVPAFLTLNRGMFLGLGLAVVYVAFRLALAGRTRALLAIGGLAVITVVAVAVLPVQERLSERLDVSTTTEDRASLYLETIDRTLDSPLFGYGAPRPSENDGAPSAGTQGQIWMVLFSHGFPGAFLYLAFFTVAYLRSLRRIDAVGLTCNTVLLLLLVESLYYGVLASGLAIGMIAAGLVLRPTSRPDSLKGARS